ncbi:MAG TPA: hypothetical protein VFO19_04325, partial [Vicinamibacterales bacterium]|nr:hypothetical protein [Vicinamibacterales bacterium]
DPLQAALAAGETPSPEMVAAAAARSVMRPPAALTLLGAVAVVFVATLWLNDRQSISATLRSDLSIDVLVHRSREILGALGYADRLSDSASGLRFNVGYLRFDRTRAAAGRRQRLLADRPAAIEFWFRESPVPLVADMRPLVGGPPRVGPVSFDNPPRDARGMRSIVLDPRGRLLSFQAVPDEFDTRAAAAMNWDAVFAAAGLDRREFHDAEPTWTPPAASDERRAWTGAYAEWPDIPIRLEAAAYRGYLVGFRTLAPWDRVPPPDAAVGRGQFVGGFVYALSIAGLVLAWWNLRLGRGDKRGAYRLGVFILIASVIEWLLKVDHVAGAGEMQLFRLGLGTALVQAVSAYVVYLALEPHLRRRWPEALITWSRVIGGRFSDAAVGRDVLIGLALAGIAAVVWTLAAWWFGRTTDADLVLANALSARRGLGTLVATMANAVFISVFVCFFALLMRLLFRNTIAAALAAWVPWLLLGLVSAVDGQAFSPIVTGTFGVVSTFAVFRYGLLAVTTVIATQTLDPMFRAWVAWHGLPGGGFVLALIVGVGAWACYLAIGSPALVPRRQGGLGISDGASSG